MNQNCIEVRGLFKRYGNVEAVNDLHFEVKRGEVFGILGPNGAGKTTTMEMIEGITQPDAGEIRVLGMDWATRGPQIRTRIGVQFQTTTLDDNITPREVLKQYGNFYENPRSVDELLALAQLESKADSYQQTMSGGQRQRLVLAIALVNDPELVFLDEPTAGLDPQARHNLWDVVLGMKKEGRTVVMTTHYMEEAEALCDRVAIVDKGKVLSVGTPRELIDSMGRPSIMELSFEKEMPDPAPFEALTGFKVVAVNDHWSIPVSTPKLDMQNIFEAAETLSIPFQQVQLRQASLEDVFLQKTGHSLRD